MCPEKKTRIRLASARLDRVGTHSGAAQAALLPWGNSQRSIAADELFHTHEPAEMQEAELERAISGL